VSAVDRSTTPSDLLPVAADVVTVATVRLDAHPSVVFKLGEDLISDEVQALVELVKNSYDADATYAAVAVDTTTEYDLTALMRGVDPVVPRFYRGSVTVEDDGTGMNEEAIADGWLTVSNSSKRDFKRAGRTTRLGRTPLGDKGLGRLGAQRLGSVLAIDTQPRDGDRRLAVAVPWSAFAAASRLGEVPLVLTTSPSTDRSGTRLTVYGLADPAAWSGAGLDRLARELSGMLSPFRDRAETGFRVTVRIDGRRLDLLEVTERVRDAAQVRYRIDYSAGRLEVVGRARLSFWRPPTDRQDDREDFADLMAADDGRAFLAWLLDRHADQAAAWGLGAATGPGWYVDYRLAASLGDLDKVARDAAGAPVDPGPFTGEVDAFNLSDEDWGGLGSQAAFRRYVASVHGVRVYRDGFGIRMAEDWLGLGRRWSSGTSYYNLKPSNVLGYIDLTARDNARLEEMTDREGFRNTPELQNFLRLLERWRAFTETVQTGLRRRYNEWRAEQTALADPETRPADTPEHVARRLAERAAARREAATTSHETAAVAAARAGALAGRARAAADARPDDAAATAAARDTERLAAQLVELQVEHLEQREAADVDARLVQGLQLQLELVREQVALSHEAIALGLTAEAIAHEVHQITDRLESRTRTVQKAVARTGFREAGLPGYFESVRASVSGLRRQLAHADPALRYARERREDVRVGAFVAEVRDYYNQRWANAAGTVIRAELDVRRDFTVRMNPGKLTQVLDNLVLNSEYWLRSHLAGDQPSRPGARQETLGVEAVGNLWLVVDAPRILVTDNGPGVDPTVEATLFEPFVTTKADGTGRGLGLYVISELVAAEGGAVRLLPLRGDDGRRHTFAVDLSGALAGPTA